MESFNARYPNVHFKILNNSTKKSIHIVKEGNVDFAVVSAPFHIEKPLKKQILREYHDILISGKRYSELKGKQLSINQLSKYPWISLTSEAITSKFRWDKSDSKIMPNCWQDHICCCKFNIWFKF